MPRFSTANEEGPVSDNLLSFVAEIEGFGVPVAVSAHSAEEATQIVLQVAPKRGIDTSKGFELYSNWSYSNYSEKKMREQGA